MRALITLVFFLTMSVVRADNGADDPVYEPTVQEGVAVAMSCAVAIPLIPLVGVIMCACQQASYTAGQDPAQCRELLMSRRQ